MDITAAQRLRRLREDKGLSQAGVASALGIDRTIYVKYENSGSIKRNLQNLVDFFGVSTDDLLVRNEEAMMILREYSCDISDEICSPVCKSGSLIYSELAHIEKYRAITQEQREAVDCLLDHCFGQRVLSARKQREL